MLEVIDKGSPGKAHPTPLLFVHGVMHAAWCWDEHFLDFVADKGYRAVAVSLRGHGKSSPKPLRLCSIADFVDDVDSVANSLPTRPVLIGHSMGGFIVQKYLESRDAPAAVLLASAPPRGCGPILLRLIKRHPWRVARSLVTTKLSYTLATTPERARESFFSEAVFDADVARYTEQLGEEYLTKLLPDLVFLALPKPHLVSTPLLVLGGEADRLFTQQEVHATAAVYHTEAEFFPDMGHDMMLEPGWAAVAQRIHSWLEAREPVSKLPPSG
jgi:pimeloyl-ACP methyl ester carboxylesterase